MTFKNGHQKVGGRVAGVPNKLSITVKQALTQAFDELGGVAALVEFAQEQPAEFYRIWGRMLPVESKVEVGGSLTLEQLVAGIAPKGDDE